METLNILMLLSCTWILMYANTKIRRRDQYDQFRFRLFALRDQLAIEAMRGNIEQRSDEYKHLCAIINMLLANVETHDPLEVIRSIAAIVSDEETIKMVEELDSTLHSKRYPPQEAILKDMMDISKDIFIYNAGFTLRAIAALAFLVEGVFRIPQSIIRFLRHYVDTRNFFEQHTSRHVSC